MIHEILLLLLIAFAFFLYLTDIFALFLLLCVFYLVLNST